MPKRKFRKRCQDQSEDEPEELERVLADVGMPEKPRTQGISVSATYDDASVLHAIHGYQCCFVQRSRIVTCHTRSHGLE